jgi:hypothetical protein
MARAAVSRAITALLENLAMANVWHPDASGEDSRLLAQILTVLQRLQPPDSRLSSWDLPGRLQQARMQGIGALIGSATRKLRDARPLAATPCELQLLDAALDILVGAYFLNCLSAPAGQPTGGKEIPDPLSAASPAPTQAAWSNQHYYRFMEEIATRLADGTQVGVAAKGPLPGRPPAETQAYATQRQDTPAPDDQDSHGMRPAGTMQFPPSHTQHGMRPYSRMARLRRVAGQAVTPAPAPIPPTMTADPVTPADPATAPPCSPTMASAEASDQTRRQAQHRREAESQAWADYLAQAGKAIYAGTILTATGAITLARPMLFTVLAGATMEAVCQWQESCLRPVWPVRPVGALPSSLKQQAHLWIYGHEYDDAGRFFASSYFTPALPTANGHTTAPLPAAPAASVVPAAAARAAVEAQALREYEAHLGQVLEVQELCAQVGTLGDEVIHCVPPATVRVVQTRPDYLLQWRNNELWSQWQVEAVSPHSGLARASQLRIPGPAWRASGERIGWTSVERPI